jgi:hypothetical protein
MNWFAKTFRFGGPTPEQQNRLILQMNTLNDYVKQRNIPFVPDDPNNPFVKCTNFANEKKNGDEKTEYFLNLKDGFVSLSTGNNLGFMMGCISPIIGIDSKDEDAENQFMNNYLFSRRGGGGGTANGLFKLCETAANQRRDIAQQAANEKWQEEQLQTNLQRSRGESDYQYQLRMISWRVKKEREQEILRLTDPKNCHQNFENYLNSHTRLIGLNEIESMTPIYDILVNNLGSTQGGFALMMDYRMQNILSVYTPEQIDEMRMIARQPQQKQKFISALCQNGLAIQIIRLANTPTKTAYYGNPNDSQRFDSDEYKANGWSALRRCLGLLEKFMTMQMPVQGAPMQGAPMQVQGGKLKSKSKSNRKKRNSHRRHSHKHHKHRTPKRR